MSKPVTPEIVVELELHDAAGGGRQRPLNEGEYRGVFLVGEQGFSIRFVVPLTSSEGKLQKFGVQFLVPEAALPHFPVGASFSMWEGRVIGHGRVLEILAT
ncbi:hypothetical protein [Variovorax sp. OV700]|uniref:hypothetical protein n=1 Tax=Variovorax sp. OV700 TaxID=1882826 RepID=UPI00111372A2|nr:hypothetical protein [Variovorax sp. OV700]